MKISKPSIVKWKGGKKSPRLVDFINRPSTPAAAEKAAAIILADIRKNGDKAVVKTTKKLDGVSLAVSNLHVSAAEIAEAKNLVSPDFKRAVKEAHKRIQAFSKNSMRKDWSMKTPCGGTLGEKFNPMDRVGCYIPGGTAPLVSTTLMTITLAKVAGVPEIVACTVAQKDGSVDPHMLYAMDVAGVTEVLRFGGVPAIGAMAYGTESISKVQKITGPGNAYVTAAKKLVFGEVAIDMLAGPSEIAVLADDSVPASYVAADLLSQAEHGSGLEKSLLVTDSEPLAKAVQLELVKQANDLGRSTLIAKVIKEGTLIVIVPTIQDGVKLINEFAPEHFELLVKNAGKIEKQIRTSGAIFVGRYTPESAGDFVAGPSHVLPTGGTAAMFSGLTVDDFRRRSSVLKLNKNDLREMLPLIEEFGKVEGLDAHVRQAQIRFE